MHRAALPLALAGVALVVSCRAPTQITVVLSTDVKCADLRGTTVTVGRIGEIEGKAIATSSTSCADSGDLGTLVIVPSGGDSDEVALKIIAGVGRDPESCVPPYGNGCIVARRALHFVPHAGVRVAVPLRSECNGVSCAPTDTCVAGACVSASIGDPTACENPAGCGESSLSPPAADAGPPVDAAPPADGGGPTDAGVDSGTPDAGPQVLSVSLGDQHSCALMPDTTVRCWGSNSNGQLGDGTIVDHALPAAVPGLTGVKKIAVGAFASCALMANGTVQCWGPNVGDGSGLERHSPTPVSNLTGVVDLAFGLNHACARVAGGGLQCWGGNDSGQLGTGVSGGGTGALTPAAVPGLTNVTSVTAGWSITLATLGDGTGRSFGLNSFGALGDNTTVAKSSPTTILSLTGAAQVSVYMMHACAILSGGTMQCWGYNGSGQIGDGTIVDKHTVTNVTGLTGAQHVVTGYGHTCALVTGGNVQCWGEDLFGQIGNPAEVHVPTPVAGLPAGATQIASGRDHVCAVYPPSTLRCWGRNNFGQIGDGATTDRFSPVQVLP